MFKSRLITALLLGAAFLAALFLLDDMWWGLFLLFFIVVGAREWAGMVGYGRAGRMLFPALTLLAGLLLLPGLELADAARLRLSALLIMAAALFWLLIAPCWLALRWQLRQHALAAAVGWLLLLPPLIALLHLRHLGPEVVLAVMATVWLADSAAYFSGKRFGRRKLAPAISPGKTWEGLIGALLSVAALAAVLCLWQGWSAWFVVGALAVTVLSVIGDLFESLIKRQAGMKDSGSLLPGHGGVLDRIDGLTPTLPLVAFYVYLPIYWNQLLLP